MKLIRNHALQEAVLLLALCAVLVWYSLSGYAAAFNKDWSQSPFLFPIILGGLFGMLGLITLIGGLCRGLEERSNKKPISRRGVLRVLAVLGFSLAYYAVLALVKLPYMALSLGGLTLQLSTF